jgi:hypothetical protein
MQDNNGSGPSSAEPDLRTCAAIVSSPIIVLLSVSVIGHSSTAMTVLNWCVAPIWVGVISSKQIIIHCHAEKPVPPTFCVVDYSMDFKSQANMHTVELTNRLRASVIIRADDAKLAELGYKSEFRREFFVRQMLSSSVLCCWLAHFFSESVLRRWLLLFQSWVLSPP